LSLIVMEVLKRGIEIEEVSFFLFPWVPHFINIHPPFIHVQPDISSFSFGFLGWGEIFLDFFCSQNILTVFSSNSQGVPIRFLSGSPRHSQ
jgi:hypothetical protein